MPKEEAPEKQQKKPRPFPGQLRKPKRLGSQSLRTKRKDRDGMETKVHFDWGGGILDVTVSWSDYDDPVILDAIEERLQMLADALPSGNGMSPEQVGEFYHLAIAGLLNLGGEVDRAMQSAELYD